MSVASDINDLMLNFPSDVKDAFTGGRSGSDGHDAHVSNGGLFSFFNWTLLVTAAIDVALFAWMHFTPEGMAFGAAVADWMGFTSSVAESADLTSAVTAGGEEVFVFD